MSVCVFQDELVEIEVKFCFERHIIRNDIDNLLKFVMDSLQKARIIDMMKATGKANKIDLKVFRYFLVDPSEYVYDAHGVAVYENKYHEY